MLIFMVHPCNSPKENEGGLLLKVLSSLGWLYLEDDMDSTDETSWCCFLVVRSCS